MKRTIYLPDELAQRVDEYLKIHRSMTFSSLVQEALRSRVAPPDLAGLLELAGFVKEAHPSTAHQPEDMVFDRDL